MRKSWRLIPAALLFGCGMSPDAMRQGIHAGAFSGDVKLVAAILKRDKEYATDNFGEKDRTPLHVTGKPGIGKLLIDHGADVNAPDSNLDTPLHTVRNALMVEFLIRSGGDIEAKDVNMETPVQVARDPRVFEALIRFGAKLKIDGVVMRKAVARGNAPLLDALIENGGDPDLVYGGFRGQEFLLHRAVKNGEVEVVKVLVRRGAKIDALGPYRATPLHFAALYGKAEVARILVANGADVWARLEKGATAWSFSVKMPSTYAPGDGTPANLAHSSEMLAVLRGSGSR